MTDVELIELGDRGDSLDVVVVQAVARIDLQALASGVGSTGGDALELGVALGIRGGIGVAAGVDLDEGAPLAAAASICNGSASMKRDT